MTVEELILELQRVVQLHGAHAMKWGVLVQVPDDEGQGITGPLDNLHIEAGSGEVVLGDDR